MTERLVLSIGVEPTAILPLMSPIAVNAPTKGALVLVTKDWFVSVVC